MVVLLIFENLILLLLIISVVILILVVSSINLVCISCSDKLAFHIKDIALWIHQVLLSFPFNLNRSEHLVISQVDALLISAIVLSHLPITILITLILVLVLLLTKLLLVRLPVIILLISILVLHDVGLLGSIVVTVNVIHVQQVSFLLLVLSVWVLVLAVVLKLLLIYILKLLVMRLLVQLVVQLRHIFHGRQLFTVSLWVLVRHPTRTERRRSRLHVFVLSVLFEVILKHLLILAKLLRLLI